MTSRSGLGCKWHFVGTFVSRHSLSNVSALQATVLKVMLDAFEASKTYVPEVEWLTDNWAGMYDPKTVSPAQRTGVPKAVLQEVRNRCRDFTSAAVALSSDSFAWSLAAMHLRFCRWGRSWSPFLMASSCTTELPESTKREPSQLLVAQTLTGQRARLWHLPHCARRATGMWHLLRMVVLRCVLEH